MLLTSVRDTVSSVGFGRGDICLSGSSAAAHACHIRHALALDECRVKFMPEYFLEMNSPDLRSSAEHSKLESSGVEASNENTLERDDRPEVIIDMVDTPASEGSTLESMGSITGDKAKLTVVDAISCEQSNNDRGTDRKTSDIKEVWFPGTHSDVYVYVDPVMSSLLKLLAEVERTVQENHFMQVTSRSCGCVGRRLKAGWF